MILENLSPIPTHPHDTNILPLVHTGHIDHALYHNVSPVPSVRPCNDPRHCPSNRSVLTPDSKSSSDAPFKISTLLRAALVEVLPSVGHSQ